MSGVQAGKWPRIALGEIAVKRRGSVDPQKFLDETFELYSIPAYDAGRPEIITGAEIGSSKQLLEPDDVVISRIVPHIQRVWIVGPKTAYRQIGSGEWIAYRSKRLLPQYLRHALLSPSFHASFMSTVAGVGGSLLRARPSAVAEIEISCPPLDEQRRIAAILDKADAIRRKRQQALALADDFLRSAFLAAVARAEDSRSVRLAEITTRITDGTHLTPNFVSSGVPFIFVRNFDKGRIDFNTDKYITDKEYTELYRRCPVETGDILYTTVGATYGQAVAVGDFTRFAFQRHVAHIKPDRKLVIPEFLEGIMQLPLVKRQADRKARGAAQPTVNLTDIREFEVPLLNLEKQKELVEVASRGKAYKAAQAHLLIEQKSLFASLSQRAFRGEL